MNGRTLAALAALGLFVSTIAVVAVGFHGTTGCRGNSWWSHDFGDFLQPYVVLATLAFAGASYFLVAAASARRGIAVGVAVGAFLLGGTGIWFLAVLEALTECPP